MISSRVSEARRQWTIANNGETSQARTCSNANGSVASSIALLQSGIGEIGGPGGTQTPNQCVMSALL